MFQNVNWDIFPSTQNPPIQILSIAMENTNNGNVSAGRRKIH